MKIFKPFTLCFFLVLCYANIVSSQIKYKETADSTFVNLKDYSNAFTYDMKYATADNFLKAKVYDCAECYLRLKTVRALIAANASFQKQGFKIKIFDCYRPLSIQKRMFKIVPNPTYVADPSKGSVHNRGGAVDITLVDEKGNAVDFGTPFDFFGKEASHSYKKWSKRINSNRKFLRRIMEENGFQALDSEWWHYDFSGALSDTVSNFIWDCN